MDFLNDISNKIIMFIVYFCVCSFFPVAVAYNYNGEELEHYEQASEGKYFLYKPTDEEYDAMNKELDDADIEYDENVISLRKQGMTADEATDSLDYPDITVIMEKYPGHNPPREIIEEHINDIKQQREERVCITVVIMFFIYSAGYAMYKNKESAK